MNILLTGSTGVVGRRLVPLLRRADHDVTAVTRSAASRRRLEGQGVRTVELDLFDASAVERAVAGRDAVVNLATHIPNSSLQMFLPWAWRENDRLRRTASRIIAHACIAAGVSRLIQESFAPVYPDCGDRWIDETTPIRPVRYNLTIADAEASAEHFSQSGRTGVVLRFGAFYGHDALQTVELISWIKKGRAPIPGVPDTYISSVSHDDAAGAVTAALTVPAGLYNVVDDEPVTHRVLVDSLADALGVEHPKLPPHWVTPLFGSLGELLARSERISNRKLRAASDWRPQYPSVRQGWPAVVAQLGKVSALHPRSAKTQPAVDPEQVRRVKASPRVEHRDDRHP
jgi:nucleoside-diphosphate-sugar epimerase